VAVRSGRVMGLKGWLTLDKLASVSMIVASVVLTWVAIGRTRPANVVPTAYKAGDTFDLVRELKGHLSSGRGLLSATYV
jgi:hypothetical protein